MLYKIHNSRPASQGIWVDGKRVMVKSGSGLILEMGEGDAQQARKRVELTRISDAPKIDTFAHEFIADINRLQGERIAHMEFWEKPPIEFQEVEPAITNGQSLDLAFLSDDELRALCKSKGIKVHHKAGRAKLLDALA